MTIFEKKTFWEAIKKYGEKSQIMVVFEEMSELQKELCKALRGIPNIDHIAEEIADEVKTVRLKERVSG